MDDNGFRRAQVERQTYYSQQQQQGTVHQSPMQQNVDILRQQQQQHHQQQALSTPSTASTMAQTSTTQSYNYPYNEGFVGPNIQQNTLPYQIDYTQEAQRAHQQQSQFQQFEGNVMYNMPQQPQQPQQQPQQVFRNQQYDAVQPYQQRPSVQGVLQNQLSVPQHYFLPTHDTTTTTASSIAPSANAIPSQFAPIGYAQTQQQPMVERQYIATPFPQPTQQPTQDLPPQTSPSLVVMVRDAPQMSSQSATVDPLAEAYASYQNHLLRTYEKVRDGQLADAAKSLLELSGWLLKNVEYLNLVLDNSAQREARLKLWTDFNRCWLALLQKQRETSESELESDQTSPNQTTRIERDYLEKMGNDLTELCNDIEKWGLVDYELGVWEEEIIDILLPCLDLATLLDSDAKMSNGAVATTVTPSGANVNGGVNSNKRKR